MAAGLGFKDFVTGDVLTSADANGYLQSQTVMVFADSAARTAAITSPQEGMYSYLKGTDATQVYNGSTWVNAALSIGAGFIPIVSGSFSSATTVNVNNCFTSTYDSYLLSVYTTGSGGVATMKLRVGGVDNSTNYSDSRIESSGTSGATITGSAQASVTTGWKIWPTATQSVINVNMVLVNPALALPTFYNNLPAFGNSSAPSTNLLVAAGYNNNSTAFDGFTLTFASATSGNYRVYGLKSA